MPPQPGYAQPGYAQPGFVQPGYAQPWGGPSAAWARPPAPPATPVAPLGKRIGARAIDAVVEVVLFFLPFLVVSSDRVVARIAAGVLLVAAYEGGFVLAMGATPGKLIAGLRVVELDETHMAPATAFKRGLLAALSLLALIFAPVVALGAIVSAASSAEGGALAVAALLGLLAVGVVVSVVASPLRRGFHDRALGTFVIDRASATPIATADLPGLADIQRPPTPTPWGPAASFEQRRRARASRLDNAPVLVLTILGLAFAGSVPNARLVVFVLLAALWEILFVTDETWRIARYGGTGGHRRAGLAVVDRRTGEAPAPVRSLVRAVLVSLPLYVLPGLVLAGVAITADHAWGAAIAGLSATLFVGWMVSLRVMAGRGLHDLAAGTVVVASPHLQRHLLPEER